MVGDDAGGNRDVELVLNHRELPADLREDGVEELRAAGAVGHRRGADGSHQRVDFERRAAEELRHPGQRDAAFVDAALEQPALVVRSAGQGERERRRHFRELQRHGARRRVRECALELPGRRLRVVELLGDDRELALRARPGPATGAETLVTLRYE